MIPIFSTGFACQLKFWWRGIKISENKIQIQDNKKPPYEPLYQTNQDGDLNNFGIKKELVSVGQKPDRKAHRKRYKRLNQYINTQNDDEKIEDVIFHSTSRGGPTAFTSISEKYQKYDKLRLCILEAPPASVKDVIKRYAGSILTKIFYNQFLAYRLIGGSHSVEKNASAKASIKNFSDPVPLLIVSSIMDDVVPHQSSYELALGVAAKWLNNKTAAPVYFLQLDRPGHEGYRKIKSLDGQRYQNFVHAVYRRHKLPYIKEFADKGECEFATAELTNKSFSRLIEYQKQFDETKDKEERKKLRQQALNYFKDTFDNSGSYEKNRAASMCAAMPLFSKQLNFFDNDAITADELATGNEPGFFARNPFIRDFLTGILIGAAAVVAIGLIGYFAPWLLGVVGLYLLKVSLPVMIGIVVGFISTSQDDLNIEFNFNIV